MATLTAQAEKILSQAKQLDAFISSNNLQPPSFERDTLASLPPQYEATRRELIDSTQALKRLAQGVAGATTEILYSFTDITTLRAIYHYKIPHAVPLTGSATYDKIAEQVSLPSSLVSRFLRHAMASQIFTESQPGHVSHTAISHALATDAEFFEAVGLLTDEFAPASNSLIAALDRYPGSQEPSQSGFNVANDTRLPIYQSLLEHPARRRRLGMGMQYFTRGEGWHLKHLRRGYNWDAIDKAGGLVVDIGGGHGAVSQFLAASTNHVRFIVQDLEAVTKSGAAGLPAELKERIDFMPHDFFTEQPIHGADVYFMRWILHNWSDKYCVQILRSLVPALRKGSKVILYEFLLSDKPVTKLTQKQGLNLDMLILSSFNSSERTISEWQKLFEMANENFRFEGAVTPEGSTMGIVQAIWL